MKVHATTLSADIFIIYMLYCICDLICSYFTAIRIELCTDVMSHDAVKRVIALREDWIKNLHSASRVSSGGASVRYTYDYLFWIRIVIVTISCQFSLD